MILNRLNKKETEELAQKKGWQVESDQNGVKRIIADGVLISSEGGYSALSVSIAAEPKKVKKHRLTTTVPTKGGPVEVEVGEFDHSYEAADYASEVNLPENNYKITEVEVGVVE